MFGDKQDIGIIFVGLPRLLLEASNLVESESDYLVKCARAMTGDSSITHDQQIFRDIRTGTASFEDVMDYLGRLALKKAIDFDQFHKAHKNEVFGDWYLIKAYVQGMLKSVSGKHEDIEGMLKFIMAHCEVERLFLRELRKTSSREAAEQYISNWLDISHTVLLKRNVEANITFHVRFTLYWTAILEKITAIWIKESNLNLLKSIMPTHDVKKSDFSPSSEKLLIQFKKIFEQENCSGKRSSWKRYYKHIAIKKQQDSTLGVDSVPDFVDPSTDAIKKQFQRWREGNLFTLDAFRRDVYISHSSFDSSKTEMEAFLIVLISNVLTKVQKTLVNQCDKRSNTDELVTHIESEFAKVDDVRKLVDKRFDHFVKYGELQA